MARRYVRDNRGRFASGGGGATARGGRLKTAAGNKRATQTMRAQGAGGAGVIKGRAARTVAGESVMRKLPKAAPKAVVTGKGARLGGEGAKAVVATKQAAYRSASAKSRAAGKESAKYGYKNEPYNPKNFFGGSAVRAANMAKASPEKLAEFKSLQKASSAFSRNRLKAGKASVELSNKAYGMKGAANASRPGTMLRPKSPKPAAPAKAKAPREQRLERAIATASRIEKKRKAKADATREEFVKRRQISSRAGRKGKFAAFQKEDQAGASSANAMRSWLRAGKRTESLRSAKARGK